MPSFTLSGENLKNLLRFSWSPEIGVNLLIGEDDKGSTALLDTLAFFARAAYYGPSRAATEYPGYLWVENAFSSVEPPSQVSFQRGALQWSFSRRKGGRVEESMTWDGENILHYRSSLASFLWRNNSFPRLGDAAKVKGAVAFLRETLPMENAGSLHGADHAPPFAVVVFRHPGSMLHPRLAQEYLRTAEKCAQERKLTIIVQTHATALLDVMRPYPDRVFTMTPSKTGVVPCALTDLYKRDWLDAFSLGELYVNGEIGGLSS